MTSINIASDSEDDSRELPTSVSSRFVPTMDIINQPNSPRVIDNIVNGWNDQSIKTLNNWRDKLVRTSYIFSFIKEKYTKRQDWILILIAICGGLITLINTVASALSPSSDIKLSNTTDVTVTDNTFKWAIFGLNVSSAVLAGMVALLSYIIKLKQWGPFCEKLSNTINKIDDLYNIIDLQLLLPPGDRMNASEFIIKYNSEIQNAINDSPNIDPTDYQEASNQFNNVANNPITIKQDYKLKIISD